MMSRARGAIAALLLLSSCACSQLSEVRTLNEQSLASSSATLTLERWCADHHMAADPKVVAVRVSGALKVPSNDTLQRLGALSAADVKYRHVELRCGAHVLSEADNWYVPARLTPEMNRVLDTSDTPFGKVVRPLQPHRTTIEATPLWPRRGCRMPREVFRHRAVLYTSANQPFAEVVETYRDEVLEFGQR